MRNIGHTGGAAIPGKNSEMERPGSQGERWNGLSELGVFL